MLSKARTPLGAAALSFLFPGLGALALGARRRAAAFAAPAALLAISVLGVGVATLAGGGRSAVLDLLLRPEVLVTIVALDLAALAYHLLAIADAWFLGRRAGGTSSHAGPLAIGGLAALVAVTTLVHGAVAQVGLEADETLTAVFPDEPGDEWAIPEPSFEPDETEPPKGTPGPTGAPGPTGTPGASPTATPTPTPTPEPVPRWAEDGRLNILLVGSDAGTGRWLLRTDTMIVLSVDIETGRAALFGIPRNMVGVPLPPESASAFDDGRFPGLLNALYVYAWGHPGKFPGGDARGFRAVTGAIQELVGVRLDAFAAVDLRGFVKFVNAIGGLWIDVPERLIDQRYPKVDDSGLTTIDIRAGCQKLNGTMALAYARSRHQDSDYGRMRRQQRVLLAIRDRVDPVELASRAPEILKIMKDHLWTTVKRSELAGLAELAARVDVTDVKRVAFVPPTYSSFLSNAEIKEIRRVVRRVFKDTPAGPATPEPNADHCP